MNIVLLTLNATYQHTAFGLRYLQANLKEYQNHSTILEYTLQKDPREIVEQLKTLNPRILGLGVYIWNTQAMLTLVKLIRQLMPETFVVLGGPEVSFETETQEICKYAHYTICGEGEVEFYKLCHQILNLNEPPLKSILRGPLPEISELKLPYSLYSDEDLRHRYIYVEASRGCPFKCEYCLSSLDTKVRAFDLDLFLNEIHLLLDRGARSFKFIDRTFNLNIQFCIKILNFFLSKIHLGLFLHFEMVPDRLPEELKSLIQQFPKGSLQFEIGIQTWNPQVAQLISRKCDFEKAKENFYFLSTQTQVHSHADLIVGLPGETLDSFAQGFNQLYRCQPDEIQLGLLKRLKGTPIIRHDHEWAMLYQVAPPFTILQTKTMSFEEIQKMTRFSRYWDLFANSGNFKNYISALLKDSESPFLTFWNFSEYLSRRHSQSFAISLLNLTESAWNYMTQELHWNKEFARPPLLLDYSIERKRDVPHFLREDSSNSSISSKKEAFKKNENHTKTSNATPRRQQKHQ
ncbi:MAG TPA: DUF4080 domain-containing protein [Pseudobdellovibrionaceae bacterium]|mgnify:CR=1 FL=1|nr:DUF4080 domain-containing protein [Pseudobdellovibrionaceae bacterium]